VTQNDTMMTKLDRCQ